MAKGYYPFRNGIYPRLLFVAVPISVGICAVYNLIVSFVL